MASQCLGRARGRPAGRRAPRTLRRRGWLMRRLLLIADLVGLVSAFLLALVLVSPTPVVDAVSMRWEVALFAASLPLWVLLARMHGLYDRDEERTIIRRSTTSSASSRWSRSEPGASSRSPRSSASRIRTSRASWSSGGSRSSWFLCSARSCASSDGGTPRTSRTSSSSGPARWRTCWPARSTTIPSTD